MSARLKLKSMKHRIAMTESENNHLRYELARLSRTWEFIGVRQKLEYMLVERLPDQYLKSVVSHMARALTAKMCENLEECIAKHISGYDALRGDTLDIRLLIPRFDETSVEVTSR